MQAVDDLLRTAETAETIRFGPAELRLLVHAADTGAFTAFEYTATARFSGPIPHYHKKTEELFYVTEGHPALTLNGQERTIGPGEAAFVPIGCVHKFANETDEPCKFICVVTPGGFERYFRELKGIIESSPTWPPADMAAIIELASRYDTYVPS